MKYLAKRCRRCENQQVFCRVCKNQSHYYPTWLWKRNLRIALDECVNEILAEKGVKEWLKF